MPVTREDVLHIASLARLRLDGARVDALARELNSILAHVEVLATVDTGSAEPAKAAAAAGLPLRSDVSAPPNLSLTLEQIAPEMKDGFFIVPRLATHEDSVESGA